MFSWVWTWTEIYFINEILQQAKDYILYILAYYEASVNISHRYISNLTTRWISADSKKFSKTDILISLRYSYNFIIRVSRNNNRLSSTKWQNVVGADATFLPWKILNSAKSATRHLWISIGNETDYSKVTPIRRLCDSYVGQRVVT